MHGFGRYEYGDGRIYEGEYVKNVKNGFGIYYFEDKP